MQRPDKIRGRGAWSTFLRLLSNLGTHQSYTDFLREEGFEDFLKIPPYSMRHRIGEALLQRFHAEIGTSHLSYGEYKVLPLD